MLLEQHAGALNRANQARAELISRPIQSSATLCIGGLAVLLIAVAYPTTLSESGISIGTTALLAVLVASTLSSIGGFAFSAICGVMLLSLMHDPVQVVEIMMVCSVAIQGLSVILLRKDIAWRELPAFLLGGIIGLPVGVLLLLDLKASGVRSAIAILLIAYAAYSLLKRKIVIGETSRVADMAIGVVAGVTGGLAGFPGAAVTVWCSLKGWDKRKQRGVYQPFILTMQIMALGLIQLLRTRHAPGAAWADLQFVPMAFLGTWLGLNIFRRLSDRSFAIVVNVLLLVSGVGLLM